MAEQSWRVEWVQRKCDIATRLHSGEAGGGYAESVIIICAVLSALAAEMWTGRNIDRVRFLELLALHGSDSHSLKAISVPLLARHLTIKQRYAEARTMQSTFVDFQDTRVLTGSDVDKSEGEILKICPHLELKLIRSFSYASLIYGEIRSPHVHEYSTGMQSGYHPMTMKEKPQVSYINRLVDQSEIVRMVHFHFEWLAQITIEAAAAIDRIARVNALPLAHPAKWWAEGGKSSL